MQRFRWSTFYKEHNRNIDRFILYISLLSSIAIIFNIGYDTQVFTKQAAQKGIFFIFQLLTILLAARNILLLTHYRKEGKMKFAEIFLLFYYLFVVFAHYAGYFKDVSELQRVEWVYVGIFALFLIEISKQSLFFDKLFFNPTLLFVMSFILLIFIGTILLLLPNITKEIPLSLVDALFMATSAVCITGLSSVDIANTFTPFGQTILIILVQIGGLGIMTFTGFFGYFFSGGFSYKNQLMYTEILSENKLASVIKSLLKIVLVTFFFEAIGASLIFFNSDPTLFTSFSDRVSFAIFHAISSFCNAGFSTVPDGLLNPSLQNDFPMQLTIAFLFILGGLGFGIVFNFYALIKQWIINIYQRIFFNKPFVHKAWVISFNSRIIAITTLFLLMIGMVSFFIFEYYHTLDTKNSLGGKLTTAFFLSATPRSAGLSPVDLNDLAFPSFILMLFLMWVGASPGSTGGGIKTTTLAVATLNIVSLVRGKDRVEIFKRQVSADSIQRAFAVIALSVVALGLSLLILTVTDGSLGLKNLMFECVSAYGTVGLSLGVTAKLSSAGKIVLACIMFIGRVGALTLLVGLISNTKMKTYSYPQEKILF